MFLNGQTGGPPTKMPVALTDVLAAHQLKQGLLLALLERQLSGRGSDVTVSLFDTAVVSLVNKATNYLVSGIEAPRQGSIHPNIAPYGEVFTCKDGKRKRDIDTLMLSLGGNDIGFASLVGYAIMQDQSSIALIMAMAGDLFFAPKDHYLPMLDTRMAAAGKAFSELLGVAPSNVLHTGYERFQVNAQDNLCSGGAGLDVHKNFGFIDSRIGEVDVFARKFFDRLECLDNGHKCAAGVAQTSGFNFVATPADRFKGRGICAALAEEREAFHTPRTSPDGFKPFMPHLYLPYAHKRRLFVSPSDAYMTANSHDLRPGCHASTRCQLSSDLTQLGFAALYSGAFHRTAEAHAIVADEVLKRVRPHLQAAGK